MTLRAAHYAETEQRLLHDPIVQQMAQDVMASGDPQSEYTHPNGTQTHGFMGAANERYRQLGGTDGGHLGAIATAVLALAYKGDEN